MAMPPLLRTSHVVRLGVEYTDIFQHHDQASVIAASLLQAPSEGPQTGAAILR